MDQNAKRQHPSDILLSSYTISYFSRKFTSFASAYRMLDIEVYHKKMLFLIMSP
jgi:hypothetical protein